MSWIDDHGWRVMAGVIGSIFAGATWIVRTVFTNQKTLALHAEKLDRLHDDVKEIKSENRQAIKNQTKILELIERQNRTADAQG